MSNGNPLKADEQFVALDPRDGTPGMLGAVAPQSRLEEIGQLERERHVRIWSVRGFISDHVPLTGTPQSIVSTPPRHRLYLNEDPLLMYLHRGGRNATYYELVADANRHVQYIEVRVETDLPSNALLLAQRPLNEMLDAIVRGQDMPLLFQYLMLISPSDSQPLIYEMILPYSAGVAMGPLGGIVQWAPFAPYDAIFREAITSSSPFYRLLCACRVYEGTNEMRRWLREQCQRFGIQERMPPDPPVDQAELRRYHFPTDVVQNLRTASDLFQRLLLPHRNAIAHFLAEGEGGDFHVYLADGSTIRMYSYGAAVLLKYARKTIDELRNFYKQHLEERFARGSILPMVETRDQFIVRDPLLRPTQR